MITLGYWNIRGRAQPIRYLLSYLKAPFTEKRYSFENNEWFGNDKQKLGINLPNLPYIIDGDFSLTEGSVIPTYIARKYKRLDLLGINADGSFNEKELRVQQVIQAIEFFRNSLYYDVYSPNHKFDEIKEKSFTSQLEPAYKQLVNYLGGKDYLVGTLTYADFLFYDTILHFKHLFPQVTLPEQYIKRIESIPEIKQYLQSPDCIKSF